MKQKIIHIILALTILCAVVGVVSAAGGGEELIQVTLARGMHVQANGQELIMTDWSGQRLYPIVYNGNTYVPVRPIGSALNAAVGWEEESQTVSIGGAEGTANVGTIKYTVGTSEDNIGWITTAGKDGEILSHDNAPLLSIDVGEYMGHDRIEAYSFGVAYDAMEINIGGRQETQSCLLRNAQTEKSVTILITNAETGEMLHVETLEPMHFQMASIPVDGVKLLKITTMVAEGEEQ